MSSTTWSNIRMTFTGFVGYAEYMLTICPEVVYIRALASNTSALESFFGEQRASGNENAQRFAKGIAASDPKNMHTAMRGASYDASDAQTGRIGRHLTPRELGTLEKQNDQRTKEWISKLYR